MVPVIAVLVVAALAVVAADRQIAWLLVPSKPLATVLLFLIVGRPATPLAVWVDVGIALSVVGDVALLGQGDKPFLVGLGAFLLAHVAYVVAFAGVAVWSPHVAAVAVAALASTGVLLRAIGPGAAGMRGPVVVYGLVISAMVVSASATVGGPLGPLAPFAAAGAVLFYASDASLALNRFRKPIPHAHYLSMGLYWIGQVGIALAARGGR
ncbi:MAG TPA: lysoplasmalogenase [Polyangia bacterium]|nr:lysoplasmalogenase [Polyangia bacterium]